MAQNYTEKEICVFNGIMALCKEDKKIYNVTVQDIANAAGVGKGTLYEYFSSKEDIIIRAMMFFLDRENTKAQQIADSGMDFKGKVYGLSPARASVSPPKAFPTALQWQTALSQVTRWSPFPRFLPTAASTSTR